MAVRAAVIAATRTFRISSQMLDFFIIADPLPNPLDPSQPPHKGRSLYLFSPFTGELEGVCRELLRRVLGSLVRFLRLFSRVSWGPSLCCRLVTLVKLAELTCVVFSP